FRTPFHVLRLSPRSALFPYTTLFRSGWRRFGNHRLTGVTSPKGYHERFSRTAWNTLPTKATTSPGFALFIAGEWNDSIRTSILGDRKSTRLNSSHDQISYAVFCLKKK